MNLIYQIHTQLQTLKNTLLFEIEDKNITHNYFIAEEDYKFLDIEKLYIFLMKEDIKNRVFLKRVNVLCEHIIYLWENEIKNLPKKNIDDDLKHIYGNDPMDNRGDFHYFYLELPDDDLENYGDVNEKDFDKNYLPFSNNAFFKKKKERFFEKEELYKSYRLNDIIKRCEIIKNWISDAYSDTEINVNSEEAYSKDKIYSNTSVTKLENLLNVNTYDGFTLEKKKGNFITHPDFDPNLWSNDCYNLFKYLYDYYYKKNKKRELTNIWFFLKEDNPTKYTLKATKEDYSSFIYKNYDIKLKNFDKAPLKYEQKESPTMNNHRVRFEETFK